MKTLFAAIFIAFLTCGAAFGQHSKETNAGFEPSTITGLRGGFNYSWVGAAKGDVGFHAGLFLESQTKRHFGITGELFFSRQTCRDEEIALTTNYITLPVLLNIYAGVLRLQAGAYAAYLLKAQIHNSTGFAGITQNLAETDAGVALGLKLDLGKVGFGTTYLIGLQNLIPQNYSSTTRNVLRSRNVLFTLSYDL